MNDKKASFDPIAAPENISGLHIKDVQYLKDNMHLVYEDLMKIFVASKIPITLWGSHGSGKNRIIEDLSKLTDENGIPYQVITVYPSTQNPTNIFGVKSITEDNEKGSNTVENIEQEVWNYYNDKGGLTIIFVDNITTYTPGQQNSMLDLLTHGKYGDIDILPYTTFVMSANSSEIGETTQLLSESIIRRSGHIPFVLETEGYEEDNNLIPNDQMGLSERVLTELFRVYEIISEKFKEAPREIYDLYIKEALRAISGDKWVNISQKLPDLGLDF